MPTKIALPFLFLAMSFAVPASAQEAAAVPENPHESRRPFRRMPRLPAVLTSHALQPPQTAAPLFTLPRLRSDLLEATGPSLTSSSSPSPWTPLPAPQQSTTTTSAPPPQPAEDVPIADNSFLIEEAYNQEYAVVQHISGFFRDSTTGDFEYAFTQEWPVQPAPRNQFSYTIPVLHTSGLPGSRTGLGDALLNWRYQLLGSGADKAWFSPRFSLVLPTGDSRLGRGSGALGYQVNLPLSVRASRKFVTHWNAGATITPNAKNELDEKATTYKYFLGSSFIWLAHPRFNCLLETLFTSSQSVIGPGDTTWTNSVIMNPGVRWAWNFENGLQIVPGVAFPVEVGRAGRGQWGIFLYLSFEHPFTRTTQ